jgi:hypothetical protein
MDASVTQTTTTTPASTPAPAAPVAAAPVAAAPAMPMAESGAALPSSGSGGDSFKDVIKSISPTEVIIGVLVVAALAHSIDYFRNNAIANKEFMKTMNSRLDEIDMKMADVSSMFNVKESSMSAGDGFM